MVTWTRRAAAAVRNAIPLNASNGVNLVRNSTPKTAAMTAAAANSGRKRRAMWVGDTFFSRTVSTSSMRPKDAALAHMRW